MERQARDEALAKIRHCRQQGRRVLGVDGFQIVPGGVVGRLDLILDLSASPIHLEEASKRAEHFVTANAADDVLFEVVADDN